VITPAMHPATQLNFRFQVTGINDTAWVAAHTENSLTKNTIVDSYRAQN